MKIFSLFLFSILLFGIVSAEDASCNDIKAIYKGASCCGMSATGKEVKNVTLPCNSAPAPAPSPSDIFNPPVTENQLCINENDSNKYTYKSHVSTDDTSYCMGPQLDFRDRADLTMNQLFSGVRGSESQYHNKQGSTNFGDVAGSEFREANIDNIDFMGAAKVPLSGAKYYKGFSYADEESQRNYILDINVMEVNVDEATFADKQNTWTNITMQAVEENGVPQPDKTWPPYYLDKTGANAWRWFFGAFLFDLGVKHQSVLYATDAVSQKVVKQKFLYELCYEAFTQNGGSNSPAYVKDLLKHCTISRGPLVKFEAGGKKLASYSIHGAKASGVVVVNLDMSNNYANLFKVEGVILVDGTNNKLPLVASTVGAQLSKFHTWGINLGDSKDLTSDEARLLWYLNSKLSWFLKHNDYRQTQQTCYPVSTTCAGDKHDCYHPDDTIDVQTDVINNVNPSEQSSATTLTAAQAQTSDGKVCFIFVASSAGQPYLVFDNLNLMIHQGSATADAEAAYRWYNPLGIMTRFIWSDNNIVDSAGSTVGHMVQAGTLSGGPTRAQEGDIVEANSAGTNKFRLAEFTHNGEKVRSRDYPHKFAPNQLVSTDMTQNLPYWQYAPLNVRTAVTSSHYKPSVARVGEHVGAQFLYVSYDGYLVKDSAGVTYTQEADNCLKYYNPETIDPSKTALQRPEAFLKLAQETNCIRVVGGHSRAQSTIESMTMNGVTIDSSNLASTIAGMEAMGEEGKDKATIIASMFMSQFTFTKIQTYKKASTFGRPGGRNIGAYAYLPFTFTTAFDPEDTYTSDFMEVTNSTGLKDELEAMSPNGDVSCATSGNEIKCTVPGAVLHNQPVLMEVAASASHTLTKDEAEFANFHGAGNYGSISTLQCPTSKRTLHLTGSTNGNDSPFGDQFGPAHLSAQLMSSAAFRQDLEPFMADPSAPLSLCFGNLYKDIPTAVCENGEILVDFTIKGLRAFAGAHVNHDNMINNVPIYESAKTIFENGQTLRSLFKSPRGARFTNGQLYAYDAKEFTNIMILRGGNDDNSNREHDFIDSINAHVKDDGWNRDTQGALVCPLSGLIYSTGKRSMTWTSVSDVCSNADQLGSGSFSNTADSVAVTTTAKVYQLQPSAGTALMFDSPMAIVEDSATTCDVLSTVQQGGCDITPAWKVNGQWKDGGSSKALIRLTIGDESKTSLLDISTQHSAIKWANTDSFGAVTRQGSSVVNDLIFTGASNSLAILSAATGDVLKVLNGGSVTYNDQSVVETYDSGVIASPGALYTTTGNNAQGAANGVHMGLMGEFFPIVGVKRDALSRDESYGLVLKDSLAEERVYTSLQRVCDHLGVDASNRWFVVTDMLNKATSRGYEGLVVRFSDGWVHPGGAANSHLLHVIEATNCADRAISEYDWRSHAGTHGSYMLESSTEFIIRSGYLAHGEAMGQFDGDKWTTSYKHNTASGFQQFEYNKAPIAYFRAPSHNAIVTSVWKVAKSALQTTADSLFNIPTLQGLELASSAEARQYIDGAHGSSLVCAHQKYKDAGSVDASITSVADCSDYLIYSQDSHQIYGVSQSSANTVVALPTFKQTNVGADEALLVEVLCTWDSHESHATYFVVDA